MEILYSQCSNRFRGLHSSIKVSTMVVEEKDMKPIIFSGDMVKAILDGRKSQTRRVVKPQPISFVLSTEKKRKALKRYTYFERNNSGYCCNACPYGKVGDRLWVRETWALIGEYNASNGYWEKWKHKIPKSKPKGFGPTFKATCGRPKEYDWKPSIHMPRWASRITLEITDIRVERLQEIIGVDVMCEGIKLYGLTLGEVYLRETFRDLWNSLAKIKWESNPYVWVITFRRLYETR